jgi:PilZ domain
MTERRRASRQKAFLQGRIFFNNRRSSVDCLIRDICEHGARLKFSSAIATPDVVELHVPSRDDSYRARIEWRAGEEAGVSFEGAEAAPPLVPGAAAPADWAARIQKLEHDFALLQRRFNELAAAIRQIQGAD